MISNSVSHSKFMQPQIGGICLGNGEHKASGLPIISLRASPFYVKRRKWFNLARKVPEALNPVELQWLLRKPSG